ncbi:MAG: acyl carrier protein [Candidatus Sulfotelmatobacter sp.]
METLQTIFQDVFDNPDLRIERSSSALTVPGWDSLAHINLVAAIEHKFKIRFALGELEQLKNVGEMLDLMERKINSKR